MTKGGEGVQWLLTLINTFSNVGDLFEKIKIVHDRLPDVVKQRIAQTLAGDTKEAKKSVRDEILYGYAVYALHATEAAEISAFEAKLRKENAPKAEAFVLFVAKGIDEFKRENKKTTKPKKGTSGPSVEQAYNTFGEGISWAVKFLRELLSQKGTSPEETFQKRITFLEGKNVFSLITPPKEPLTIVVKAKELGKKIATAQDANLDDLEKTTQSFRERAKQYRESKGR